MSNMRAIVILLLFVVFGGSASELCISNSHLTTNPHDYQKCAGVHRPNPATIKQVPGLEQKYKHHLKLETLTPGTALNHLVASTSGALALNQASSLKLAKKGVLKAYNSAIADHVEGIVNGGIAEAEELGLSAEAAETLGGIAVASGSEYVVPIVAVAALASATGVAVAATIDSLRGDTGSSTPTTQELRRYVRKQMGNRAKVKRISQYRTEVTVGVPVKCRFPRILKSKVYVNQSTRTIIDFVAANPDLRNLRSAVSPEVFNSIYQNMKPHPDYTGQFCDYRRPQDKRFPFNFLRNITVATRNEHDVYSVTRTFILSTGAAGNVLTIVPENDILHFGRNNVTFDQARYVDRNLGTLSIKNPTSMVHYREPENQLFAYRGEFGSIMINTFTRVGMDSIITLRSEMEFYQYQDPNRKILNPRSHRRFSLSSWTGKLLYWRDTRKAARLQKTLVELFNRGERELVTIGSIISGLRTPEIDQIITKLLDVKSIWFSDGVEAFVQPRRPPVYPTAAAVQQYFLFYRRDDGQPTRVQDRQVQLHLNRDALLGIAAIILLTGLEDKDPAVWEWLITKSTRISGADFLAQYGQTAFNSIHPNSVIIPRSALGSVAPHTTSSRNIGIMDFSTLFLTMAQWQRDYDTATVSRYPSPCRINISSVYLKSLINRVNYQGKLRVDLSQLVRHYLGSNTLLDAACWVSLDRRLDHVNYDYYLRGVSKNAGVNPLIPLEGPATENKLYVKLSDSNNPPYRLSTIERLSTDNRLINTTLENGTYLMKILPNDKLIFESTSNSLADVEELLDKVGGLTLDLIKIKKSNPDGAPAL